MAAQEPSDPAPLIQFHAINHQRFPPPYPASRNVPDWYKNLEAEFATGNAPGEMMATIKRCPPFLDAMCGGYIIPVAEDIEFKTDAQRNLSFSCKMNIVHTHHPRQYQGTPFGNQAIVKFYNIWIIRTQPGYSTLLVQPMNRFHLPFIMLSGIVETDNWYLEIHFPAICQLPPNTQYVMKKGTPLMQAIPFKREQWQSQVGEDDKDLREKTRQALVGNLHVYKEELWRKKGYG